MISGGRRDDRRAAPLFFHHGGTEGTENKALMVHLITLIPLIFGVSFPVQGDQRNQMLSVSLSEVPVFLSSVTSVPPW
jgi:hypothetical protein